MAFTKTFDQELLEAGKPYPILHPGLQIPSGPMLRISVEAQGPGTITALDLYGRVDTLDIPLSIHSHLAQAWLKSGDSWLYSQEFEPLASGDSWAGLFTGLDSFPYISAYIQCDQPGTSVRCAVLVRDAPLAIRQAPNYRTIEVASSTESPPFRLLAPLSGVRIGPTSAPLQASLQYRIDEENNLMDWEELIGLTTSTSAGVLIAPNEIANVASHLIRAAQFRISFSAAADCLVTYGGGYA